MSKTKGKREANQISGYKEHRKYNHPRLTDVMCNFGSAVSAMSGFSLFTRYVLLIFSF